MKQGRLSPEELASLWERIEIMWQPSESEVFIEQLFAHIAAVQEDLIKIRSSVDDMNAHIVEGRDNGAFLLGYLATRLGNLQMYLEVNHLGLTQTPPAPAQSPSDAPLQNDAQP
jgi:hypothetical protein